MSSPTSPTSAARPFRFQPISPRNSLRRLRTALTLSSRRNNSTTPSPSTSISMASPLSSSTGSHFSGLTLGNMSTVSLDRMVTRRRSNMIRRKKSMMEIEQDEERLLLAEGVMSIIEPRPRFGPALGGIEEVLSGRI